MKISHYLILLLFQKNVHTFYDSFYNLNRYILQECHKCAINNNKKKIYFIIVFQIIFTRIYTKNKNKKK